MKLMKVISILLVVACIAYVSYTEAMKRNAEVMSVTGTAMARICGEAEWKPLTSGMMLTEGDTIKTSAGSKTLLKLEGSGTVEVSENSDLLIAELMKDGETGAKRTLLDLAIGEVMIQADKLDTPESKFEVKTPTSIVGVRGTQFSVKVETVE